MNKTCYSRFPKVKKTESVPHCEKSPVPPDKQKTSKKVKLTRFKTAPKSHSRFSRHLREIKAPMRRIISQ